MSFQQLYICVIAVFIFSKTEKQDLKITNTEFQNSVDLKEFWNELQDNVKKNSINDIEDKVIFPINYKMINDLEFASTCDSSIYINYYEVDTIRRINKTQFKENYSFVFNKMLKSLILETTFEEMIKSSSIINETVIVSLKFNIEEYPCSKELVLMINFFKEGNNIKISLDTCC